MSQSASAQRILPDLQSAILCEDVRQESSGNFILLGIMAFLRVPKVPVTAMKLCVFTRWTCGIGEFTETTRLIAPDESTVLRESKVKFGLADPAHNASNLSVFAQVEFKSPGVYHVEVSVDDVLKLRFPVPVVVAPPATDGPQPGTPDEVQPAS
jgi:hypothetical protein